MATPGSSAKKAKTSAPSMEVDPQEKGELKRSHSKTYLNGEGGFDAVPFTGHPQDDHGAVLGILCGGGPAPGINAVIHAVAVEALNCGMVVLGFLEGFKHLMDGPGHERYQSLSIDMISRIFYEGGSILQSSRANPTKKSISLQNCVNVLKKHKVKYLVTIGGDDTAKSSQRLSQFALEEEGAYHFQVAHVPKTIDNDLNLPQGIPTFGFNTAMHMGCQVVKNLMLDSATLPRWFLVVSMGRSAGHLALQIGKTAGAHCTVIPEEWKCKNREVNFEEILDILEGTVVKRTVLGRHYGVLIVSEGLVDHMNEVDQTRLFGKIPVDEHGNKKLGGCDLGKVTARGLMARFKRYDLKTSVVNKNVGYELRSAPPIPFDMDYCRDLGYGAMKFLRSGGNNAVITVQSGKTVPVPFYQVFDDIGKPYIRTVDTTTESYEVAHRYMMRLTSQDIQDPVMFEKMLDLTKLTPEKFMDHFKLALEKEDKHAQF